MAEDRGKVRRASRWMLTRIRLRRSIVKGARAATERPLTEWELLVVTAMLDVGGPGSEVVS